MSYSAGETLVLARLKAITGSPTPWDGTNTSQGKWKFLNDGKADHYAVLRMGSGSNAFITGSVSLRHYTTVIEVWQSYKDDGTSYTNLLGYFEAILDKFDANRLLGDTTKTVEDSICTHWDEVEEMWTKSGGPRWLRQNFYIEWSEENAVTFAE